MSKPKTVTVTCRGKTTTGTVKAHKVRNYWHGDTTDTVLTVGGDIVATLVKGEWWVDDVTAAPHGIDTTLTIA